MCAPPDRRRRPEADRAANRSGWVDGAVEPVRGGPRGAVPPVLRTRPGVGAAWRPVRSGRHLTEGRKALGRVVTATAHWSGDEPGGDVPRPVQIGKRFDIVFVGDAAADLYLLLTDGSVQVEDRPDGPAPGPAVRGQAGLRRDHHGGGRRELGQCRRGLCPARTEDGAGGLPGRRPARAGSGGVVAGRRGRHLAGQVRLRRADQPQLRAPGRSRADDPRPPRGP